LGVTSLRAQQHAHHVTTQDGPHRRLSLKKDKVAFFENETLPLDNRKKIVVRLVSAGSVPDTQLNDWTTRVFASGAELFLVCANAPQRLIAKLPGGPHYILSELDPIPEEVSKRLPLASPAGRRLRAIDFLRWNETQSMRAAIRAFAIAPLVNREP